MSQQVDTGYKAFRASAAITKFNRVKMDTAGTVSTAGLADRDLGIAQSAAFASGDIVQVKLRSGMGTAKMVATGVVTAGNTVYTAASGRISATQLTTGLIVGTSLETNTASGDIIEVLPGHQGAAL